MPRQIGRLATGMLLLLAAGGVAYACGPSAPWPSPPGRPGGAAGAPPESVAVALAMLERPDGAPERGCDDVGVVERRVPYVADSLTTALQALFALRRDSVGGARHFLGRTRQTLAADRVRRVQDTVHVYLTGSLSGVRGACDNPRARIQIQETLRRVARADSVVLYLNGRRTALQPDLRGRPGR